MSDLSDLMDRQWHTLQQIKRLAESVPGVSVSTGNRCRAIKPCGSEVHNLHMTECHGKLTRHEGPHSWEVGG